MKLTISNPKTGGDLLLIHGEQQFDHRFYTRDREKKYFTLAWNHGSKQTVSIDGAEQEFPSQGRWCYGLKFFVVASLCHSLVRSEHL